MHQMIARIACAIAAWLAAAAVSAADLKAQRLLYPKALAAAYAGKLTSGDREALNSYPLMPYIELTELQRAPAQNDWASTAAWLKMWGTTLPGAGRLRESMLALAFKRADWRQFLQIYDSAFVTAERRCQAWQARMALFADAELGVAHARALVQDAQTPAQACTPAFTHFAQSASDAAARFLVRIEAQLKARQFTEAAASLQFLPASERGLAQRMMLLEQDPKRALAQSFEWPQDVRHRELIVRALAKIAAKTPRTIEVELLALKSLALSEIELQPVRLEQARFALIENWPEAPAWLDVLPPAARDTQVNEWGVRRALSALNPALALARIDAMQPELRDLAKWRYVRGRLHEWLGSPDQAVGDFQSASSDASFFGFLAADRLGIGYALCPEPSLLDAKLAEPILSSKALPRMVEFFALGETVPAKREWMNLIGAFDPAQRRQAGILASQQGWAELGILALNQPPNRKLYHARFPILETETLTLNAARNGLDPAFVAGLIRQESAWNPTIASHAGAIGLMQMLPSTAAITAKTLGISGRQVNLRDAKLNLKLGTKHLADLAKKYANSPMLMTAAYNAGPNALKRWIDPLYASYPDLWIETVPFKETRDYISTVLAFTVIYDYRFDQTLSRLSNRVPEFSGFLPSTLVETSVPTRCSTPTAASNSLLTIPPGAAGPAPSVPATSPQ